MAFLAEIEKLILTFMEFQGPQVVNRHPPKNKIIKFLLFSKLTTNL